MFAICSIVIGLVHNKSFVLDPLTFLDVNYTMLLSRIVGI